MKWQLHTEEPVKESAKWKRYIPGAEEKEDDKKKVKPSQPSLPGTIPDTLSALPGYIDARKRALEEAPILPQAQPGKHAISGFTKIGTSVPHLLGMGGAALEALATGASPEIAGYSTGDAPSDKSFGERYDEAAKEGIDADLIQAGKTGREWVYGQLGIGEPKYTSEKIADLAGTLTPIPAAWIAPAVSAAGKAGNLLKGAFYATTPLVQGGPGYGKRAAWQYAIGAGIDQGIHAAQGQPLWFSDVAAAETPKAETPEAVASAKWKPHSEEAVPVSAKWQPYIVDETQIGLQEPQVIGDYNLYPSLTVPASGSTGLLTTSLTQSEQREVYKEFQEKTSREEDWETTKDIAILLTALGVAGGLVRYYGKEATKGTAGTIKSGKETVEITKKQTAASHHHERFIDAATAIKDSLRSLGVRPEVISKVIANAHTDVRDLALNFGRTGKLSDGFRAAKGKKAHAPMLLRARFNKLSKEQQSLFDEAMGALAEKAARKGTETPGELFKSGRRPADELDRIIAEAKKDDAIRFLMRDTHETFDVLLDYSVHRGVHTKGVGGSATKIREANTLSDGSVVYMPFYHKVEKSSLQRLRSFLTGHGTQARRASIFSSFGKRGDDINFKLPHLTTMDAVDRYSTALIMNANEQSFAGNVLDALSGMHRTLDVGTGATTQLYRKTMGQDITGKPALAPTARKTVYLGKGVDLDDIDKVPFIPFTGQGANKSLEGFSGSFNDLIAKFPKDEIKIVHQGGELRAYHVPDPGIRAALDLNPQMTSGIIHMGNRMKNLMTRLTTGNLSFFAPKSWAYAAQQTAVNTFARDGAWRGITSPLASMAGSGRLFYANAAGDIAKYMANRFGVSVEGLPDNVMQRLGAKFHDIYLKSPVVNARTESGRTASTVSSAIGNGTMPEIMEGVIKGPIARFFNDQHEIALAIDMWNGLQNAFHEGPAYGAYLRAIGDEVKAFGPGEISPKQMAQMERTAVDKAKQLSGDMRKMGASKAAQGFSRTFPFGSAMLQSWNSIGRAAKLNPAGFFTGTAAIIGMPTVSEMVWNKNLSDGYVDENGNPKTFVHPNFPGKQWTYNDYYWNGFTAVQRANNHIVMIPDKPPWEAAVFPVSPEWALYKGTVTDLMDATFNFSDVGNIAKAGTSGFQHTFAGLAKLTDVALPPFIALLGSAVGADVRLGLAVEKQVDPDDPGSKFSVTRTNPFMSGERLTSRTGKGQLVDSHLENFWRQGIQDILGAAGSQYILFTDAFKAGASSKTGGTFERGLDMALQASKEGTKTTMSYLQPLWGKSLHQARSTEISQNLFVSKKNLQNMATNFKNVLRYGGVIYSDGKPVDGDALLRTVSDDPEFLEVAASAKSVLKYVNKLDPEIRQLERDLKTVPTSAVGEGTKWPTVKDRNEYVDGIKLKIQSLEAQQLAIVREYEVLVERQLEARGLGTVDVDFTEFASKPQVPGSDSLMKSLRIQPQISQ